MRHALGVILFFILGSAHAFTVSIENATNGTDAGILGVDSVTLTVQILTPPNIDDGDVTTNDSSSAPYLSYNGTDASVPPNVFTLNPGDALYDTWFTSAGIYQIELNRDIFHNHYITGDLVSSSTETVLSNDFAFTAAAVPVPAAVWLFGSGLGLLGWFRRRAS